jgi:flavin-dependent dehydrogenase
MYDIAIIGAGPAGTTLARLIGDRYKVLLLDKRHLTDPSKTSSSRKCCGGLLAPDAQGMLSKMGLGLPKSVLVDPQLFVVRAVDVQQHMQRYYQRYYINLDRLKFDRWLLSMTPKTVEIRLGCRFKSYEPKTDGFKIWFAQKHKMHAEHARILVGADGASSAVRKLAVPNHSVPKKYFSIQESVEANSQLPYFCSIFDPQISDYYSWTIPKEHYLFIGSALHPRQNAVAKFELLKKKLRDYGFRFGKAIARQGAFILRPVSTRQISTGAKSIALVGEAAGWISPSSAEGLSYAFKSALSLAKVLHKTTKDFEKRYYQETRQLRNNILVKNVKSRFIYNPWLRNVVMRSGYRSMEIYRS